MPLWDNTRYETEARKIAQTWHEARAAGGSSLTALVTKVARDASLNPEQIERLARIANGHAFNAVFEAAKTAKERERYPDFDVADAKAVVAELFASAAQPVAKTASYGALPDQFDALRARPDPLAERHAKLAAERAAATIEAAVAEPPVIAQYHNAKAAADKTKSLMLAAEARWNDALAGVRKVASRVGWRRDDFEVDALALLGADALPELNILRKEAGLTPIAATAEKVAAFQDRHVGTESEATRLLKVALDQRADYAKWKRAAAVADAKLAALRSRLHAPS